MINVAVISEYNPFHYGHKNQIDYLRAKFDEDITVISLMSGNYVQRGEPSIISKYKRAEIAVNNGIDLVLEYPFPFCSSGASYFAFYSVLILNNLKKIDYIAFGCESFDCERLSLFADRLSSQEFNFSFSSNLKKYAKDYSYIRIRDLTFFELYHENLPSKANDILALEYMISLKKLKSNIKPIVTPVDRSYSATDIRKDIVLSGISEQINVLPEGYSDLPSVFNYSRFNDIMMTYILGSDINEIDGYFEGNRALASFVKKNSLISKNFDELLENSTSNMFTRSRVKRFILFSYFEVSKEIDAYHIESINLLAANLKGREFLSSVRKDADIKVKTKSFKRKNKLEMLSEKSDLIYYYLNNEDKKVLIK